MGYEEDELFRKIVIVLVGAFFGAACVSPAGAAEIRLGGVLPGGGVITKSLVSMREARYANIIQQRTDFSCGAAALATILKYAYGLEVTEDKVIREMLKFSDPNLVRERGFSLLDVKHYVESLGMRGRGYKVPEQDLSNIKIPTIVLIDYKGYKHFVVLERVVGDRVYFGDPALGNRIISKKDFLSQWNGIIFAVIGQGFDRDTALLKPREQLTARGQINTWRPVTDVELREFGFRSADFF